MGAGEHTAVYFVGDFDYGTGEFAYQVSGRLAGDLIIVHRSLLPRRMAGELLWGGRTNGIGWGNP